MQDRMCHTEEGDLRLVDRVDINGFATGALQVFIEGAFGAVCNTLFGPPDAEVACRQMGFTGGTVLPLELDQTDSPYNIRPEVEVLLLFNPPGMPNCKKRMDILCSWANMSIRILLISSGRLKSWQ